MFTCLKDLTVIKKLSLCLLTVGVGFVASCTNQFYINSVRRAENWQPQIEMPSSVVVCRQKQCAPAKLSMSKEYIYNSLLHLLDNNSQNKALLCRADATSHICTENYVTIPVTVGVTPANMYIDDVKITDVSASIGSKSLDLILNYNVSYNGQSPVCKPAKTLVYVKNTDNIIMEDAGYSCKMTTIGNTTIKTLFAIDYIDLDYGYIGGYYSIGLSGPAYGGDSGYMLMRLPQDAYPLSPDLILKEEPKPEEKQSPTGTMLLAPVQGLAGVQNPVPVANPVVNAATDGVPVPMVIDAKGNPVPVIVDASGKPVMAVNVDGVMVPTQMSHTVVVGQGIQAPASAVNQPQQVQTPSVVNPAPVANEVSAIKEKVKAKKSSDIETTVTTKTVSQDNAPKVSKITPKASKIKSDEQYEGVKIFPLPVKKKNTVSDVKAPLKDEVADTDVDVDVDD